MSAEETETALRTFWWWWCRHTMYKSRDLFFFLGVGVLGLAMLDEISHGWLDALAGYTCGLFSMVWWAVFEVLDNEPAIKARRNESVR